MNNYKDLDTYNGDAEHDMWVDFDNYENTGNPDVFSESDIDNFIDYLNDWD
ncbi:MAG: hypothetical protein HDS11_02205 [Bacteroides sp.]|nr:hypothetical protein [Bacteroides sp.]